MCGKNNNINNTLMFDIESQCKLLVFLMITRNGLQHSILIRAGESVYQNFLLLPQL